MTAEKSTTFARIVALALLLAGILLDKDVVGYVVSPDKSSVLATAILALQGVLLAGGVLLLLTPGFLPKRAALRGLTAVVAFGALLFTVGGRVGLLLAPPVDYRYFTYPSFTCEPQDPFCNRAEEAGLRGLARYGKGVALVDMNNDGWLDLFLADAEPRDNEDWGVSDVYLNNGDGSFTLTDVGFAEDDLLSSWTASFADIDNDGDQDAILTGGGYAGTGWLALYENRMNEAEGRFVSITDSSGIGAQNNREHRWWGAGWADYDGDGYLDLAVSRVDATVRLLHNNGDMTFTDVTDAMEIVTYRPRRRDGKNIVWFDYDYDGDMDLYYAGIGAHMFYENVDGTAFKEVTSEVFDGVLPENWAYPKGDPVVFSAAAVDINQDGWDDLYLGRQIEQDVVLFNDGKGNFTAQGAEIGIDANLTYKMNESVPFENTMGLGIGDLGDDGWPDILIGVGDPIRADADIVYCNKAGRFERCTELLTGNAAGEFRQRTHGIATGDIDRDGHTDVVKNLGGHAPWDVGSGIDSREEAALYIAQPQQAVNTANILLEGVRTNRDAIGARIKVTGDATHYYTVRSTQAFQSQNERAQLVTLGQAEAAEVEITWPDGEVTRATIAAGDRVLIRQGDAPVSRN